MATKFWTGNAKAIAQVAEVVFGTYDGTTTRRITIGGTYVEAADSGGTLTAALAALAALLNASEHPYFAAITWSSTATKIIGTADVEGVPFTFSASVSGGTGTVVTPYAITTAPTGPNHWDNKFNWSDEAVPVSTDTVIFKSSSVNVCWGIDQNAVTLTKLVIEKSFTGRIGLNHAQFATTSDGATVSTPNVPEYRDHYLKISATESQIGIAEGPGTLTGSDRIKINFGAAANQVCTVWDSASAGADEGYPAILILANHNTFKLYVRNAPGAVGVCKGASDETSTMSEINITADDESTSVYTGDGLTLTTWFQGGGDNVLRAAGTITTVSAYGGSLLIEGDYTITTLNVNGSTVKDNHFKTGGNAVTTANFYEKGGSIDFSGSNVARTYATTNLKQGAAMKFDKSIVTFTSIVQPDRMTVLSVA